MSKAARPRDFEDAIQRTPEYEQFMAQLDAFHRQQGTSLTKEPVLGGKKLDLFRIYKWVQEAGGYEKVTQERGWKKVTTPFDLPPTCTNSAYVVKQLYQRYLYNWEQVHVHGKPLSMLVKRPFETMMGSDSPGQKKVGKPVTGSPMKPSNVLQSE
ncbi:hypothetical protein HK104_001326 [Borealophlyctis nickersoniae]|nr:hypothetical protein HK104_001326 [Borealophlyctis nickersoniae]